MFTPMLQCKTRFFDKLHLPYKGEVVRFCGLRYHK